MRLNYALIASEAKRRNDFPKTGQGHFAWHFPNFQKQSAVGARPKCGNGQVFKAGQKFRPGRCAGHFQPCAVRAASTLQV
jgi:hypothetical protein